MLITFGHPNDADSLRRLWRWWLDFLWWIFFLIWLWNFGFINLATNLYVLLRIDFRIASLFDWELRKLSFYFFLFLPHHWFHAWQLIIKFWVRFSLVFCNKGIKFRIIFLWIGYRSLIDYFWPADPWWRLLCFFVLIGIGHIKERCLNWTIAFLIHRALNINLYLFCQLAWNTCVCCISYALDILVYLFDGVRLWIRLALWDLFFTSWNLNADHRLLALVAKKELLFITVKGLYFWNGHLASIEKS